MREWADLPEELLNLIVSRLFATDRRSFGLVCRSWNAAASGWPDPLAPCLMFYRRSKHLWGFSQNNSLFYMSFPELDNAEILCSKHGWLLVCRDEGSLFFFNPFNRQATELPCTMNYRYSKICFFNPPTSPDCIVVGIASPMLSNKVEIGLLRRGLDKWESYTYQSQCRFYVSMAPPVLHCGVLYFLDLQGSVATFDIDELSGNVKATCLKSHRLLDRNTQHFLFKCRGEEAVLAVVLNDQKVNVFRLLEPDMNWELVRDLGDKVLYLSHTLSFGHTVPSRSMANRIYFNKFLSDNDKVVFYSLNTKKYHSLDDSYASYNSKGLRSLNFATWITPPPTPKLSKHN